MLNKMMGEQMLKNLLLTATVKRLQVGLLYGLKAGEQ